MSKNLQSLPTAIDWTKKTPEGQDQQSDFLPFIWWNRKVDLSWLGRSIGHQQRWDVTQNTLLCRIRANLIISHWLGEKSCPNKRQINLFRKTSHWNVSLRDRICWYKWTSGRFYCKFDQKPQLSRVQSVYRYRTEDPRPSISTDFWLTSANWRFISKILPLPWWFLPPLRH